MLLISQSAFAQDPAIGPEQRAHALVEEAAELGRTGRLREAIAKFKDAEALHSRATHYCNIGLAYTRLRQWPQAQLYLSQCRERWSQEQTGPIDDWVNTRLREAIRELQAGSFAPVGFHSEPTHAHIQLSSFLPDESFTTPRVVWLPIGSHEATASLSGHGSSSQPITVSKGTEQEIRFVLQTAAEIESPAAELPKEPETIDIPDDTSGDSSSPTFEGHPDRTRIADALGPSPSSRSTWPWIATGAGIALVGVGAFAHSWALDAKHEAEGFAPGEDFDQWNDRFRTRRTATVALYGLGAATIGVGVWFLLRSDPHDDSKAWVQLQSTGAQTGVALHWSYQ